MQMTPFCVEWFPLRFTFSASRGPSQWRKVASDLLSEGRRSWRIEVSGWMMDRNDRTLRKRPAMRDSMSWEQELFLSIHRQLRDMIVLVVVVVAMPLGSGTCLPIWFGWIGWENLQESPVFHGKKMKKHGFSTIFPQKSNWYVQVGVIMCNSCNFAVDPMLYRHQDLKMHHVLSVWASLAKVNNFRPGTT